ncbi:MAG: division/cell wall cluster transcriptional repressor MraZ [Candidatus Blackburnbacteria bacterium RIFCSPHIGHO2_02_FULL_39_13]|uniref:Transcriptional regulator MraZ n=1 Tax=Candidatus Blackburnbacteria bacterium RIFCSPLOWO2_01_FULL_40_20 TaxID=1797519 RepID=A0A1G1VE13_9BACT|nr:MAG: Protein MraZ [Microgenomates group bacterium GW2011_GWA2_39_19]OGY06924.1 MAG: division/cell wall cluster transcriptional repressor MraZ [Candidatus Blackburnbacteria bacterium RIFCSPHIGHO2_01_FULL_40_17]OGY09186.1 MAG: division/cell wall cluster transcriptional repressor MraZ [Candidatus Blackburnbacteria bacterium RIFCSPHIGHO2_02_FULL_39_13]OGY13577.1 MAG: division/cell wall cluster transcriptional repressor MraZ [Candidatus Blackburnbacteria bacterium RIFCSPLOWO2_01_FULL_40_20]HBL522
MLIGQYHTKISNKGRTAVPARFRKELGDKVVITRWYEQSIAIFSPKAWERILDLAVGGSLLTRPVRETERFLLGGAYEEELDAQGRIVIPLPLREIAQISEEIVFVGLRDRVEIWNKSIWEEKEKEISGKAELLIEEVQKSNRGGS